MNSKFEYWKSEKDGQYYFHLLARNHKNILRSEGYTTKQGCLDGIASVKINAPDDDRYQRLRSKDNKHYFNLTANNNRIIGTSETYETAAGMEIGIAAVKKEAPCALIVELSYDPNGKNAEAREVSVVESAGGLIIKPKSGHCNNGLPVKPKGGSYGEESLYT